MYSDISFKTLFWVLSLRIARHVGFVRQYTHIHTHIFTRIQSIFNNRKSTLAKITKTVLSRRWRGWERREREREEGGGGRRENEINSIKRYSIRYFGDASSRSSSCWSQGSTGPDARATASYRCRCETKSSNTLCPSRNARSSLASPLPGTWSLSPRATPPTRCSSSRSRSPPSARSPIDSQPGAINYLCAVWSVVPCRWEGSWTSPSFCLSPHPSNSICTLQSISIEMSTSEIWWDISRSNICSR